MQKSTGCFRVMSDSLRVFGKRKTETDHIRNIGIKEIIVCQSSRSIKGQDNVNISQVCGNT